MSSIFSKASLHDVHAKAERAGERAVSLFDRVVRDLQQVAAQHTAVAHDAQAKIDDLASLRDAAHSAAGIAGKQALAVSTLIAE